MQKDVPMEEDKADVQMPEVKSNVPMVPAEGSQAARDAAALSNFFNILAENMAKKEKSKNITRLWLIYF